MVRRLLIIARRLVESGWFVILPVAVVIGLVLVLTDRTSAAPAPRSQPRKLLSDVFTQTTEGPACEKCHPEEHKAWVNTVHARAALDPVFQEQLNRSRNQAACLKCHTTGFDSGSGKFLAAGVTCEACHGVYKEGHPARETMKLPMASETCRMCHLPTFEEWEQSAHRQKGIECFDCHLAHTQGLRTGSETKLCSSCHAERQTQFAHATHGIGGLGCASCHMSSHPKEIGNPPGVSLEVRNHDFKVAADTCIGCHQNTIHSAAALPKLRQTVNQLDPQQLEVKAARVDALEADVTMLERRIVSLRNVAVVGMGLTLGFGGFLGILVGVGGLALAQKRRPQ